MVTHTLLTEQGMGAAIPHDLWIKRQNVFKVFVLKDQKAKLQRPLFRGVIHELEAKLWKTHCALLWWHSGHE